MMNFTPFIFLVAMFLAVNGRPENEFTSWCDQNTTLVLQRGQTASFEATRLVDYLTGSFKKGRKSMTTIYFYDTPVVKIFDNRLNVTVEYNPKLYVHIALRDVEVTDSGIYTFGQIFDYCWNVIVLDKWKLHRNQTFEEFQPAYIYASRTDSQVTGEPKWLLDGFNVTQSPEDFLVESGRMIILSMSRHLDSKSVTYLTRDNDGIVHEENMTILVTYGPYSPLQFSPSKTSYIVKSGDVLPDILCSTDCNPPCEITWDRSGVGNVLSLGKVDKSSKGMYTCQATRNGTDHVVERSLYVDVETTYAGQEITSEWRITLSPENSIYFLSVGDNIPDIVCNVECDELCDVSWESYDVTNVLSLGTVTVDMSGEYTCVATLDNSDWEAKRTVIVKVEDNTSFIVAVIVLGVVQGLTLVALFICAIFMYRTSERGLNKEQSKKTAKSVYYQPDLSTSESHQYDHIGTHSGMQVAFNNQIQ